MTALRDIEHLLDDLSRSEKAEIVQRFARGLSNTFPGIEQTDGVMGGDACIVRTRIPVWLLVEARRQGATEADLLSAYPKLRAEDLANAWAYARAHRAEIDTSIAENEAA